VSGLPGPKIFSKKKRKAKQPTPTMPESNKDLCVKKQKTEKQLKKFVYGIALIDAYGEEFFGSWDDHRVSYIRNSPFIFNDPHSALESMKVFENCADEDEMSCVLLTLEIYKGEEVETRDFVSKEQEMEIYERVLHGDDDDDENEETRSE
jgi:hypothetical protein